MAVLPRKLPRQILLKLLCFLPADRHRRVDRWLRGRHEYRKLRLADAVVISFPKSGRTWLRTMLTRFYQIRFGIETMKLVGFYNFHKQNKDIPRIFFTHDNYIKDYTGNAEDKSHFRDKKVVLLLRDPRDVVISGYFQLKYRPNPLKDHLHDLKVGADGPPLIDFVMFSLPRIIHFLNGWARALPTLPDALVVRYEDLKADPAKHLARVLAYLGTPATREEIDEAVRFAAFENMRSLEARAAFGRADRRITPGDPANPQSFKVRRGKVGGYRDCFTDEQVREIDDLVAEQLAPEFGYAVERAGLE